MSLYYFTKLQRQFCRLRGYNLCEICQTSLRIGRSVNFWGGDIEAILQVHDLTATQIKAVQIQHLALQVSATETNTVYPDNILEAESEVAVECWKRKRVLYCLFEV